MKLGGRVCEWEDGVHTKPRGCGWGFVIHCDGAIKSQTGNLGVWGRGIRWLDPFHMGLVRSGLDQNVWTYIPRGMNATWLGPGTM